MVTNMMEIGSMASDMVSLYRIRLTLLGNGVYTWASGDKYSGEWQHSQHHGNGVFEWYSGAKYFGSFKFNKRNDKHGTFTWHNGDRYEGAFKDDMLEGFGSYFHACGTFFSTKLVHRFKGDQFIGEWKGGNRHGKALYKYAYGGTFEGTFQEDNREGPGFSLQSIASHSCRSIYLARRRSF